LGDHTYDFAIIGSGSAEAIIAARLTENPNINDIRSKTQTNKGPHPYRGCGLGSLGGCWMLRLWRRIDRQKRKWGLL